MNDQFPVDERRRRFGRFVERLERPKLERSRKSERNQHHLVVLIECLKEVEHLVIFLMKSCLIYRIN